MKAFAIFGDTHTDSGLAKYTSVAGADYDILSGTWLPDLVDSLNAYGLPILGTGDLYSNAAGSLTWVSRISHPVGLISCMGNHDTANDSTPTPTIPGLIPLCNTLETGYKNSGTIWHDISLRGFRIMVIHNMPYEDEETDHYQYVNPAGGFAEDDWSGIGSSMSPQRVYMRGVMADAAAKGEILVVCGHRAVYGIYTETAAQGIRSNYTRARDTTIENGYPKGYVAELENWAVANKTHVIHINGDQHTSSITYPIYRGARTASYGVVHLAVSTMSHRNQFALDEALHYRWAYGGSAGFVNGRPLSTSFSNFSGWPTWIYQSGGLCPYTIVEKEWDGVYINTYLWAHEGYQRELEGGTKASEQLVETIKIPLVNGKLVGEIASVYGLPKPLQPTTTTMRAGGNVTRMSAAPLTRRT